MNFLHSLTVTESLMTFQQAEQMVQQNADDSDIVAMLDQQRPHHQAHHEQKGKNKDFTKFSLLPLLMSHMN